MGGDGEFSLSAELDALARCWICCRGSARRSLALNSSSRRCRVSLWRKFNRGRESLSRRSGLTTQASSVMRSSSGCCWKTSAKLALSRTSTSKLGQIRSNPTSFWRRHLAVGLRPRPIHPSPMRDGFPAQTISWRRRQVGRRQVCTLKPAEPPPPGASQTLAAPLQQSSAAATPSRIAPKPGIPRFAIPPARRAPAVPQSAGPARCCGRQRRRCGRAPPSKRGCC